MQLWAQLQILEGTHRAARGLGWAVCGGTFPHLRRVGPCHVCHLGHADMKTCAVLLAACLTVLSPLACLSMEVTDAQAPTCEAPLEWHQCASRCVPSCQDPHPVCTKEV
jgi:hypothetical protein